MLLPWSICHGIWLFAIAFHISSYCDTLPGKIEACCHCHPGTHAGYAVAAIFLARYPSWQIWGVVVL